VSTDVFSLEMAQQMDRKAQLQSHHWIYRQWTLTLWFASWDEQNSCWSSIANY